MADDAKALAQSAKERGNAALSSGDIRGAIAAYTDAISLDATDHIFYSNRSAAHLRLGDAASAIADAELCVHLRPRWAKGFGRLGAARFALKSYADAARAYEDGLRVEPDNEALLAGLRASLEAQKPPGGQVSVKITVATSLRIHARAVDLSIAGRKDECEAVLRDFLDGTLDDADANVGCCVALLADVLLSRGEAHAALELLTRHIQRMESLGHMPETQPGVVDMCCVRVRTFIELLRLEEAEAEARRLVARTARLEDEKRRIRVQHTLVRVLYERGKMAEAWPIAERVVAGELRLLGSRSTERLSGMNTASQVGKSMGRTAEAEALSRECVDIATAAYGASHTATIAHVRAVAEAQLAGGKVAEAEATLRAALPGAIAAHGELHEIVLVLYETVSGVLLNNGRFREAVAVLRKLLDARRRTRGEDNISTVGALSQLAAALCQTGELDESEKLARRAISAYRKVYGIAHICTLTATHHLLDTLRTKREVRARSAAGLSKAALASLDGRSMDEEVSLGREALEAAKACAGEHDQFVEVFLQDLAKLAYKRGELDESCDLARQLVAVSEARYGPAHEITANARMNLTAVTQLRDSRGAGAPAAAAGRSGAGRGRGPGR